MPKKSLFIALALFLVLAAACAPMAAPGAPAQVEPAPTEAAPTEDAPAAMTPINFTLDWAVQGPQAPFLVALDRGHYAAEGLDVTVDRGFGSADAVSKVASGAYQMGYADINSMIEFNVANPDEAVIAVAIVLNYAPFSILTLAGNGIESVEDLAGRTLGAPAGDAPRRLFPAFAEAVGIDVDSVEWISMDPPLREPLLIQGEVEAISGFYFTSYLNLIAAGVEAEDITAFLYADHGLELYGNAVIAPPSLLEENPEMVRSFLRALTAAWHDTLDDPASAVAVLKTVDPLIDEELELARLTLAIENNMLTPDVAEFGFGDATVERLEAGIAIVVEAFGLPETPAAEAVFDGSFLPPLADRLPRQ
jgi:NitT/TauT family transport system substrate-binding protein